MIYATGYNVSAVPRGCLAPSGNKMPLYLRVVPPDLPGLYFMGFIQTVGSASRSPSTRPSGSATSSGEVPMPRATKMRRWIDADQKAMAKRYVRSERHTMQVDYWRYIKTIKEARGRRWAVEQDPGLR